MRMANQTESGFVQRLVASRLLTNEQMDSARALAGGTDESLIQHLLTENLLTASRSANSAPGPPRFTWASTWSWIALAEAGTA